MRQRGSWALVWGAALSASYLLCRFVFFNLHGMKQYPFMLLIIGLIAIAAAAVRGGHKVMVCTVIGYLGGFIIAMLFNTYGVDPGGGRTNNAWIIWGSSFLIAIFAGVIWQILSKYIGKEKQE